MIPLKLSSCKRSTGDIVKLRIILHMGIVIQYSVDIGASCRKSWADTGSYTVCNESVETDGNNRFVGSIVDLPGYFNQPIPLFLFTSGSY